MKPSLEKMNWYNEPECWAIKDNQLEVRVTPKSDYWRISHYGFTVDDGPFYYTEVGGEFEVMLKIEGAYLSRFDQAGLMLRLNHEHYIKAGIEYVGGLHNVSVVVTHQTSDWSVIPLTEPVRAIWIKAVRRRDAVEIYYSLDNVEYRMMRNAWLEANHPLRVGMYGACPDGEGFMARFSEFNINYLPDSKRTKWLEDNQ